MRNATYIVVRTPHRRRTNPLHARTIVCHRVLYVQVIEIDIQALFGAQEVRVVDRRLQQLANRRRHAFLSESQRVPRLFHAPSLDQVQHQPRLLRRDAHVSGFSSKFHRRVSSTPSAPPALTALWLQVRRVCPPVSPQLRSPLSSSAP